MPYCIHNPKRDEFECVDKDGLYIFEPLADEGFNHLVVYGTINETRKILRLKRKLYPEYKRCKIFYFNPRYQETSEY